ncbi:hypothetical protein K469DRAFT_687747 [Zopfia rhizophila CBS 207.26]|uniref:Uncharacterized protein n=1 Tax=Zopfia rhizophila CBS 207.26 TaxID=1314779 RepID=A0A6A6E2C8_9PEZI|nr:hypothetical protein K469DRAFT_687747 [Zopfia rhizophila CBS 207.26]
MRHWPHLVKECPRTEKGAKKLTPTEPYEATWYSSNRIRELTTRTPSKKFQPVMPGAKPLFVTSNSGENLQRIGKGISSFYVRQSVWFAFFEPTLPSQSVIHEPNSNPFRTLIGPSSSGQSHKISAITTICSIKEGPVQNLSPPPGGIQNNEARPKHEVDTAQSSASLLQQLADQREEIAILKNENNRLQALECQSKEYRKQLEESKSCSMELQSKVSRLQQRIEDDEAKKGDIPSAIQRVETLKAENDMLLVKLRDTGEELKRLTDDNYGLQKQLSQGRQTLQDTEESKITELRTSLQNEVERWKVVNSILEEENHSLRAKLILIDASENRTKGKMDAAKHEILEEERRLHESHYINASKPQDHSLRVDDQKADITANPSLLGRPIHIQLIDETKDERLDEIIPNEEEMAALVFKYLRQGIGLFDKSGLHNSTNIGAERPRRALRARLMKHSP